MTAPAVTARPVVPAASRLESVLRTDPAVLSGRLAAYYAPDGEHCGTNFLDGTEAEAPYTVTGGDLFAVTTLGISIRPCAARRLLHDTPEAARIADCLWSVPLDVTLGEAGPLVLRAMGRLHDAVVAAVEPATATRLPSHVLASALCARKRPELFPVLDRAFCAAAGIPSAANPLPGWLATAGLLRRPDLRRLLAECFKRGAARRLGVPLDVYPLRQLYVLACQLDAPDHPY